jgi:integrase
MPRPNSLWKRKGRTGWYATIAGKKLKLGDDYETAKKQLHALKASNRPVVRSSLTVGSLIHLYLRDCATRVKRVTVANYYWPLSQFDDRHGSLVASELKPYHVTQWLQEHEGWNSSTRHHVVGVIKTWAHWCHDQGYLDVFPLKGLKRPKTIPREPAPPGAIEKVLTAITCPRFLDLCTVLLDLGCRPGEVYSLTASQVDWETSTATVNGKTGPRVVSLTARSAVLLRKASQSYPSGPLLRNQAGRRWTNNTVDQRFARLAKKPGVPRLTAYLFRHAYWGRASKAGVDSILISHQLGHKDLSMLKKHYAHPDADQLKEAVERAAQS